MKRITCYVIGFFTAAIFFVNTCGAAWEWMRPYPCGDNIHAIWGISTDHIYTVGLGGTILHGNGTSWDRMFCERVIQFDDVWASSPNDVYAVGLWIGWAGEEGVIMHWDGIEWREVFINTYPPHFNAIWGFAANDIWACGYYFNHVEIKFWHYDGISWTEIPNSLQDLPRDLWGTSSNDLYIVGWDSVYRWDGSSFSEFYVPVSNNPIGIYGFSNSDIYILTEGGLNSEIYHYDGSVFSLVYTTDYSLLSNICGSSPDNVYACGGSMLVHWNGSTWQEIDPAEDSFNYDGIWCSENNDAWMIGSNGFIVQYDGSQFDTFREGRLVELYDIWGTGPSDLYVTGIYDERDPYPCTIMHWNGSHWTYMTADYPHYTFYAIWGTSSDNIYATGYNWISGSNIIIRWNGSTWSTVHSGSSFGTKYSIWGTAENNIYFAGRGSDYYNQITRWDGISFSDVYSEEYGGVFQDIFGLSENDIYAANGDVLHWNGTDWSYMSAPAQFQVESIWGVSSNNLYGVYGNGIWHWDGLEWNRICDDPYAGFESVWGASPQEIYFVGGAGYTLYSDSNGFYRVNTGTLNSLNCVTGFSSSEIFACGRYGTVLHCDGYEMSTPTMGPSVTPTPTPGNSTTPTPTPTQSIELGVTLEMPSHFFHPGDACGLNAYLHNNVSALGNVPFFVILQIENSFYYYPSWTTDVTYDEVSVPVGVTPIVILSEFVWPDTGATTLDGIVFWGAMTNPEITEILGGIPGIGQWTFGFGPP